MKRLVSERLPGASLRKASILSSSSSLIIIIISHHHHNFHHHHQELLFHDPLKQARKLRDEVYGSETYMPTNQVKISITQRNQVVIQRSSLHLLNIPTNQVKKNFANSKIKILGSPASSLKSFLPPSPPSSLSLSPIRFRSRSSSRFSASSATLVLARLCFASGKVITMTMTLLQLHYCNNNNNRPSALGMSDPIMDHCN